MLTFAPAGEFDSDAGVDVLGKVEDRLALGLVERWLGTLWPAVAPPTRCGSTSL